MFSTAGYETIMVVIVVRGSLYVVYFGVDRFQSSRGAHAMCESLEMVQVRSFPVELALSRKPAAGIRACDVVQ